RDIACPIDANEEERHATRLGALQRAEPMADRLEADPEIAAEQIDVVAQALRPLEKRCIRQNQRTGKIVRQTDVSKRACLLLGERPARGQIIHQFALFEEGKLRRHLERLLSWSQPARQPQAMSP